MGADRNEMLHRTLQKYGKFLIKRCPNPVWNPNDVYRRDVVSIKLSTILHTYDTVVRTTNMIQHLHVVDPGDTTFVAMKPMSPVQCCLCPTNCVWHWYATTTRGPSCLWDTRRLHAIWVPQLHNLNRTGLLAGQFGRRRASLLEECVLLATRRHGVIISSHCNKKKNGTLAGLK